MRLSIGQSKAGSEILGNMSVAWFSASIIAPFFLPRVSFEDIGIKILLGVVVAIFFATVSLWVI